jgi:hypothetical protein
MWVTSASRKDVCNLATSVFIVVSNSTIHQVDSSPDLMCVFPFFVYCSCSDFVNELPRVSRVLAVDTKTQIKHSISYKQ